MSRKGAEGGTARAPREGGFAPKEHEIPAIADADLRLVIDSIPAMAWSARADGTGRFFNQRYLDYVGLSLDQICDWQWTSLIHPDDIDLVTRSWEAFSAAKAGGEVEVRLRRHDGVFRWFSFRSNPLCDADGNVVQWYGVNIDIDEQKRTATMLAGERRLLELVASGQPPQEVLLTLCEVVEQASPGCYCEIRTLEATGSFYEHVVAPSLPPGFIADVAGTALNGDQSPSARAAILNTQIVADDIEADCRWHGTPVQAAMLAQGLKSVWATPISSKDGNMLGVLLVYSPKAARPQVDQLDIIGRGAHIASIAIERFRAENELRRREFLLVTAERISETGSFSWDLVNNKLIWSEQMYHIHELDPNLEPVYPNLRVTVHPDDLPMVDNEIARLFRGEDNPENEKRLLTPDGRVKYISTATRLFHHADGRRECIGVAQDITRRRLAEDALDELRSELAHVTRVTSLGELAASIAHEVNQPLAGIITNASTCLRLLANEPPDIEGAIRTAQRSIRDGNRASEVIRRLRGLYRKQDFAPEPFHLNEAAQEVIAICTHDLQRRRIMLGVDLDDALPHVVGDRIQLQQVILNLVLNAADALGGVNDRPRQIFIRSERGAPDSAQFTVRDTGTGVAPEDRDRIFQAFCTTKPHGMGIGLSVSRSIIDRHGGKLWTVPNEGPGAIFAFSLPLRA